MTHAFDRLEVRKARTADLGTVLPILEDAARRMVRQRLPGWTPGALSRRRIAEIIDRGEMYLALLADQAVGTFALQWSDQET